MNVKQAYNLWANQYDTNNNKTRDLEAIALRAVLANLDFSSCLEIGCGTGKNTEWLISRAKEVTAVDFSEEMLQKAKAKITSDAVTFLQADITKEWQFTSKRYALISFSLVLEHIEHLEHIFQEASKKIAAGGHLYIGELHPFKQYTGSKARFDTEAGQQFVTCYTHHISDFSRAAKKWGFEVTDINEYFDDNDRSIIPRILTLVLKKV